MTDETRGAVSFKGRMTTLTVLEISTLDMSIIEQALTRHVQKSPEFFRNMPVLLSCPNAPMDVQALVNMVRGQNLVPVALSNPTPELAQGAAAAGIGVLNNTRPESSAEKSAVATTPEASAAEPVKQTSTDAARPTRLISAPVRSGQQIYAKNADLIVTAAVSEGAEIIADGHIHVYGALRGRALAGASGERRARIFCRRFEAELVAVAGCYKVAEDMQESVRGKAVQVRLSGENLIMDLQE